MDSEKFYAWLQSFCIFINIVYMCVDVVTKQKAMKGDYPVLHGIFYSLFCLVWQIGCYYLIKLIVKLLIIIFNFNIGDYCTKIALVTFTILTLDDLFCVIYKTAKGKNQNYDRQGDLQAAQHEEKIIHTEEEYTQENDYI